MPWVKLSDTGHSHPAIMRLACVPGADDRTLNEAVGLFMRLCMQSAQHLTDRIVDRPAVVAFAGLSRADALIDALVLAGLLEHGQKMNGFDTYRLLNDEEGLTHVKTRQESDIEKRNRRDTSNPALTGPVRRRDGDVCRYCGRVVQWGDRRGGQGGTYDHLIPLNVEVTKASEMVVACRTCNSKLQRLPNDQRRPLLMREPEVPFYKPTTLTWFKEIEVQLPARFESNPNKWVAADVQHAWFESSRDDTATVDSVDGARRDNEVDSQAPDQCPVETLSVASPSAVPEPVKDSPCPEPAGNSPSPPKRKRRRRRSNTAPPPPAQTPPAPPIQIGFKSDLNSRGPGLEYAGTGRDGTGRAGGPRLGAPNPAVGDMRIFATDEPSDSSPLPEPAPTRRSL